MLLIAGLGNPGAKYENNRHNIGFMALDSIARAHGFTPWKKKFRGLIAERFPEPLSIRHEVFALTAHSPT